MSSKKRKLRENTDRREVWGANKQTAKRLEAERAHKNEVHALKQDIANQGIVIGNLIKERDKLRRLIDSVCDPRRIAALRHVTSIGIDAAVNLGLDKSLIELVTWLGDLQGGVIENVRIALADFDRTQTQVQPKTMPNAEPLMPRPSGITKLLRDHDDQDSVDDLFAKAVDVHIERMDENHYWMGIIQVGGLTTHIDITWTKKTGLRAWVRK